MVDLPENYRKFKKKFEMPMNAWKIKEKVIELFEIKRMYKDQSTIETWCKHLADLPEQAAIDALEAAIKKDGNIDFYSLKREASKSTTKEISKSDLDYERANKETARRKLYASKGDELRKSMSISDDQLRIMIHSYFTTVYGENFISNYQLDLGPFKLMAMSDLFVTKFVLKDAIQIAMARPTS